MTWNIHGHNWAVNLLHTHAAGEKLRHAYLLTGPEGVGRRTLALRFAQALICTDPPKPGAYCDQCRACRQIRAHTYPDLSLLEPEEGHQDIRIDQIRSLQHTLALSPYAGKYRIALLPDFQRTTIEAANALLKTLEEPPERVILLLTADTLESLLPTIVSRCEVIRLRPASIASTQAYLESEENIPPVDARLVAHLSGGRIGFARHLAQNPATLKERQEILETFLHLLTARRTERFKLADRLARPYDKAREKAGAVLPIWLSFWRDVFTRTAGAQTPLVNLDIAPQVQQAAALLDIKTARSLVIAHEKALQQLAQYANVRLLLETLMLQWPILTTFIEQNPIKFKVAL
jgi:DNA polymerase-3 subunit delta'